MKNQHKSIWARLVALFLVLSLVLPCPVLAATPEHAQPYASNYLTAYNTYICNMGSGNFQIWYEVVGKGDMDEIGVLTIELYEVSSTGKETWIKSFLHEDYESMLATDDWYHCSYVSYTGVSTKTYKAYVCIWAGKNGGGDTRYMWAKMA